MTTTTPTPWTAIPAAGISQWPRGSWIIIGPEDDNGESHTVAVVPPCDDSTHPFERREADARHIAKVISEVGALFLEMGKPQQRHHLLPGPFMTITGPALHETQIRAYALLAASNAHLPRTSAGWEEQTLALARKFERYIKESEDSPS